MRRPRSAVSVLLALIASTASAQTLGAPGQPITTSRYTVDLFQGPVLASARITGLGGAYVAIANGAEGLSFNPAAASLRPSYSMDEVDYDLTAGLTLPASVLSTDFDNDGREGFGYSDFLWLTAGGVLQLGRLGFGLNVSAQTYQLGEPTAGAPMDIEQLSVQAVRLDLVTSYGFFDETLHVGGGLRIVILQAGGTDASGTARTLLSTSGVGAQLGVLWAPRSLPVRVGVVGRSPVASEIDDQTELPPDSDGNRVIGDFYLPDRVALPWEVEGGVALHIGQRELNADWHDEAKLRGPEVEAARRTDEDGERESASSAARRLLREREALRPRPFLLLSASVLVTGPVSDAVGFEAMLQKTVQRSGERTSVGLRLGAELEAIPGWLQVRAGGYLEPTRFTEALSSEAGSRPSPRVHGTLGLQAKLFSWDVFGLYDEGTEWRVSLAGDLARQYFGWGVGVGVWH